MAPFCIWDAAPSCLELVRHSVGVFVIIYNWSSVSPYFGLSWSPVGKILFVTCSHTLLTSVWIRARRIQANKIEVCSPPSLVSQVFLPKPLEKQKQYPNFWLNRPSVKTQNTQVVTNVLVQISEKRRHKQVYLADSMRPHMVRNVWVRLLHIPLCGAERSRCPDLPVCVVYP